MLTDNNRNYYYLIKVHIGMRVNDEARDRFCKV